MSALPRSGVDKVVRRLLTIAVLVVTMSVASSVDSHATGRAPLTLSAHVSCAGPGDFGAQYLSANWPGGFVGVPVYSNGSGSYSSNCYNYVSSPSGVSLESGMEWQCVELVNRLYIEKGWISTTWWGNGDQLYYHHPAGLSPQPQGQITYLAPGDMISFSNANVSGGHAAIISAVSGASVTLVNQNTSSANVLSSGTLSGGNLVMNGWAGYVVIGVIHAPMSTSVPPSGAAVIPNVAGALSRYSGPNGHISTTGPAPSGYSYESTFGSLLTAQEPGTVALYLCEVGTDYFTSTLANCEGQSLVRLDGWIYTSAPPNMPSVALYRCRVTSTGTHFDTLDPNCEGQSLDAGLLGYLVALNLAELPSLAVTTTTTPTTTTSTAPTTAPTTTVSSTSTVPGSGSGAVSVSPSAGASSSTTLVTTHVRRPPRTMSLVGPRTVSSRAQRMVFRVDRLDSSATGLVRFFLDGRPICRSRVTNGVAVCRRVSHLRQGRYSVVARYLGNNTLAPRTERIWVNIVR